MNAQVAKLLNGKFSKVKLGFFAVDKCVSPDLSRCDNGATCVPVQNDLVCSCVPGFTGYYCEINIDDCAVSPCVNGICNDLVDDYSCTCDSGRTGFTV